MKSKYILFLGVLICSILLIGVAGCDNSRLIQSNTSQASVSPLSSKYAKELLVFAAAGTKPAIDEASKLFEQKYGTQVSISYGGGGEVLSNMVISKRGDIYLAPEQRFMTSAVKQGAVGTNSPINSLAYMIPVIGVKKGNPLNIQSLADLAKPGIKIAMGNPETTALGVIAPEILQKAALYDTVKKNIATNAPQVTSIVTMLKMGQVDAGFIWHYFGTAMSNDVDIIWIPREYVTGIGEIQAAVSVYSQEFITAQKFIELLVSSEGKEIFKKNGYVVDSQEEDPNIGWQISRY